MMKIENALDQYPGKCTFSVSPIIFCDFSTSTIAVLPGFMLFTSKNPTPHGLPF